MDKIYELYEKDRDRFSTAAILVLVLCLVGLINSFFVVWAVLGTLFLVGFHESMKLFNIDNTNLYVYAAALWLAALIFPNPTQLIFVVFIIFAGILAYKRSLDKKVFLPFLYPSVGFLFILSLYVEQGMGAILWMIVIVASTDVGAYFTGKSIGKTQFCETSPNKTLEGVAGGVIAGTVLGAIVGAFFTNILWALVIALLASIASVFGDLYESYLKREADVKDSGNILPGHGGILDRTDGYLFASIIMVLLTGL